jgi:putative FmdB family regulatory protein
MPIYEYRCENGHSFDEMQRISDDPIEACNTCGAPAQRVFRPVAIHFKGSGFYNTDYGTRKRQRENKESASSAEGSSTESKSDAKPSEQKASESKSSESKSSESKSESKGDTKAAAA